ncbi:MAG: class I SAM-dependent methyltransferase [Propionibacteriales bacterium]|nr:class I SAM-dependent methyltransferase [Propionibacteriales bacterium]
MTTCPACAGARVHTAVASRATGRRISDCRDCGVHFWQDHEDAERLEAIELQIEWSDDDYSNWVDIKREKVGPEAWREALGWVRDALPSRAADTAPVMYDVGAGDGEFLSVARDDFGFSVTGNEIVAGAVKLAKDRHDVDLDLGDLSSLGHKETVDAVTLWCVLAHVTDTDQLLRDTHTMLRPGGVLFLQTPHWTKADALAHAAKRATGGRFSKVPDRRIAQHHWILHTRASITAQLTRLGFVDVVAEPRLRYTLTSEAYIASMSPPAWSVRPASKMLDRLIASPVAPRIVLDVRARKAD